MAAEFDTLIEVLGKLDAEDGWRARDKSMIAFFETNFGLPLCERLAGYGLKPQNIAHKHDQSALEKAQFCFHEVFFRPSESRLRPNVKNILRKKTGSDPTLINENHAYIGFTVSHRVASTGAPAHIRWGFGIEADEKLRSRAEPVLMGLLTDSMSREVAAKLVLTPKRRVPGIATKWLTFLGRHLLLSDVKAMGSIDALLEAATLDMLALYRAIEKSPSERT